jgi:50S ribosomal protein L16 3-hydroxylase
MSTASSILGGMAPATFLREHWQKQPLLVRQALPGFRGLVTPEAFLRLATRDDATSRLVIEHPRRRGKGRWERHDGPFGGLDASMLPASHWTLLVHGVESLIPGGWELLRRFDFIPAARVDDLMVSYAADGGGVGPHDDRYDVFLLQGPGTRRWRVSSQRDREVDPAAAIRVLANFRTEEEWLLEPGDMLYLPPGVAHWGTAEGPCFTYSIGFLAPTHEALVQNFLGYLGATLEADADTLYEDPDLRPARDRLAVPEAMVDRIAGVLADIRWDRRGVADFVGRFLTGPKPVARFSPPARPLDQDRLASRLRGKGQLELALPTRGLVRGRRIFLNGEGHDVSAAFARTFHELVDRRALPLPLRLDRAALALVHAWVEAGWLRLTA